MAHAAKAKHAGGEPEPVINDSSRVIQEFGTVTNVPIALGENVRADSVAMLNQLLADTITLRDMYKKHHWQVSGATFYQLHLLYDKHYEEQSGLVDVIAERIQALGGVAVAMAPDVAELSRLPRLNKGREQVPAQISHLLKAHESIIGFVRQAAKEASEKEDDGTNDLLVSQVLRTNELQVWFLAEHLVDTPISPSGQR